MSSTGMNVVGTTVQYSLVYTDKTVFTVGGSFIFRERKGK